MDIALYSKGNFNHEYGLVELFLHFAVCFCLTFTFQNTHIEKDMWEQGSAEVKEYG